MAKILTLEEAEERCRRAGIPVKPRRAIDTNFPETLPRCWVLLEEPNNAVVVYDDDPKTDVSTGNHPRRFLDEKIAA